MSPPLSLFFDSSDETPQNKQTNDSERDPDSSRPPYDSGEHRRQELGAPLIYSWRERLGCVLLSNYSVITESNAFSSLNVTLQNLNSAVTRFP
jgi:hypothetical protein